MDGDGGSADVGVAMPKRAGVIRIEVDALTSGNSAWNRAGKRHRQADALHILIGSGRSRVLHGNAVPPLALIPLRGSVRLIDGESARVVHRNQMFVGEGGQRLQAIGSVDSLWIAFIAPVNVWRQIFDVSSETSIPSPILLPATHQADRLVRRAAVHLAREARRASAGESEAIAAALRFGSVLLDLQSELDSMIKRCPGRTLAQRRSVFVRLQRICNYMEVSNDFDLDIAGFARAANYSPCHFVRTFNLVYGESPYAVLIEQRLKRALRLVNETELSVTEVARASGFQDRSAFARSFKRRFGETASGMRERSQREAPHVLSRAVGI